MRVNVFGWETKGLRCPDTKVDFRDGDTVAQINLILMPNGTGKSTIIELIESVLRERDWSPNEVRDLQGFEKASQDGQFVLKLAVQDGDNVQDIIYQLDFDFINGDFHYKTLLNENSGMELGWKCPRSLINFLTPECVEVFVFKGDKVEHLINKNRYDADQAIKAFFGLREVEELEDEIEKIFKDQIAGPKTPQGENKLNYELNEWSDRLTSLRATQVDFAKELKVKQDRLEELEKKVADVIRGQTENKTKKDAIDSKIFGLDKEITKVMEQAMNALRNPFYISDGLGGSVAELKSYLDSMQLPGTSSQFFKELADSELCVCGREIGETEAKYIRENSSSYLAEENIIVVNGIKADAEVFVDQAEEFREAGMFEILAEKSAALESERQKLRIIEDNIERQATDADRILITEKKELDIAVNRLERALGELQDKSDTRSIADLRKLKSGATKSIHLANRVCSAIEEDLSKATNNIAALNSKNELIAILQQAREKSLSNLKTELKNESNAKLATILPPGSPLRILDINNNLELGSDDVSQSSGSGGQNVAVAYSFATSLLEKSGAEFPLIVDHPVTALQESARVGLARNLGKICHQFVGFIIDTEKAGLLDALEKSVTSVNYITLFRKVDDNTAYIQNLPSDKGKYFESDNGVVCNDKDYFNHFRDLHPELEE